MPKLSNMLGETGTVEIECPGDEPLIVVYRRNASTPREAARFADAAAAATQAQARGESPGGDVIRQMIEMAVRSWVSWNLTDADGAAIPIDVEHLLDVDQGTIEMIASAIRRQREIDPLSGNGSSNGSSPTASSEPLLSITRSS